MTKLVNPNIETQNCTKRTFRPLEYGIYLIAFLIFVIFSVSTKAFLSANNMIQLLSNCATMFVVCAGMNFVIITGALDLSVGSVVLASGMIINLMVKAGYHPLIAIVCALVFGALVGFINGICVTKFHCNAFLVTYGTQIATRGLALLLSGNGSVFTSDGLKNVLRYKPFDTLPLFVIISVVVMVVAQLVLHYTTYGRNVIALGCNEAGAAKIGIPTRKIRCSVFVVSSVCAAFAGLINVVNVGGCSPYAGNGLEFTGAAAILMGGTSMYGGKGSIIPGTLLGVILLQMMENGLTILGINPYYLSLIRGGLIFIAMFADALKNKRI